MVEEEGGREGQWRDRVWVSGNELEADEEEDEDEGDGRDCGGGAFMVGPSERKKSGEG